MFEGVGRDAGSDIESGMVRGRGYLYLYWLGIWRFGPYPRYSYLYSAQVNKPKPKQNKTTPSFRIIALASSSIRPIRLSTSIATSTPTPRCMANKVILLCLSAAQLSTYRQAPARSAGDNLRSLLAITLGVALLYSGGRVNSHRYLLWT